MCIMTLVKMKVSRVRLFVTPWTIQSMEFSRPEHWSGYSLFQKRSRSLLQGIFLIQGSNLGLISHIADGFLLAEPPGKPCGLLLWKHRVLTTGPPGKPLTLMGPGQKVHILNRKRHWQTILSDKGLISKTKNSHNSKSNIKNLEMVRGSEQTFP